MILRSKSFETYGSRDFESLTVTVLVIKQNLRNGHFLNETVVTLSNICEFLSNRLTTLARTMIFSQVMSERLN